MDTSWKNRLQEYCMKNKFPLPNYRIKNQSGPAHSPKFKVEVEVNGQLYTSDAFYSSKKQAEQSAANKAWEGIVNNETNSISTQLSTVQITSEYSEPPPPPYSVAISSNAIEHLPSEYADIENYISTMVESFGGRIRKICIPDSKGRYKFEIAGSYRYCDKVKRHHKKNQIYFMVDPIKKTYYQKCHDPECFGFQSVTRNIVIKPMLSINLIKDIVIGQCQNCRRNLNYNNQEKCDRCRELFCKKCVCECDFCCDATHCHRCFDACFDCRRP